MGESRRRQELQRQGGFKIVRQEGDIVEFSVDYSGIPVPERLYRASTMIAERHGQLCSFTFGQFRPVGQTALSSAVIIEMSRKGVKRLVETFNEPFRSRLQQASAPFGEMPGFPSEQAGAQSITYSAAFARMIINEENAVVDFYDTNISPDPTQTTFPDVIRISCAPSVLFALVEYCDRFAREG
jgi:hypothetical protein